MKRRFINKVAKAAHFTQGDTEIILNEFFKQAKIHCRNMEEGDVFTLGGFLTFRASKRDAKKWVSPANGETYILPEAKVIRVKPTESFMKYINADVVPEEIIEEEEEYDDAIEGDENV